MIRPTTYTVFLSRPSDIESDIEVVKEAISDANFLAEPLGVRFATFDWRENATPGLAIEPQARINAQADGYDVIIALLGATLGTPTLHRASGSVEEIEDAIARSASSIFGNDSVMIFFKDVKLNLSSDLDEAKKVQELKHGLGPRGILYRSYGADEDLRQGILRSLGVLMAAHVGLSSSSRLSPVLPTDINDGQSHEEVESLELGLMDYGQMAAEDIEIATKAASELGSAMRKLGEIVTEKTPEFVDANASDNKTKVRNVIAEIADAMEDCAKEIQSEGDIMADKFKSCLSSLRNIIDIQSTDLSKTESAAELMVAEKITSELSETLTSVIDQIKSFKSGIVTLPRLTKELNIAKRKLLISTENLIVSMVEIADEVSAINSFARSNLS